MFTDTKTELTNNKIKLKEIIKRKAFEGENLSQYIPIEIQHVEQIEQEIAIQQEEVVEIQQQHLEVQEIAGYSGQLLGFEEFSTPLYKQKVLERAGDLERTNQLYHLLEQELFANLPHAIKYVSPEAAEQLALNLPQLVSQNKDNLANGFLLKQTAQGEFVLDYDAFIENERVNPFTPVVSERDPKQTFSDTRERMNRFDEQKLKCLQRFLENTDESAYDLNNAVDAFEVFWNEVNHLCAEQKIAIAGINQANWSTPRGGNPVVYMERMLWILKNARSLADQFPLLNNIVLDNYGAYYASRYEGFKAVSAEMKLHYDAEKLNKEPFNKNFTQFHVNLENFAEQFITFSEYDQSIRLISEENLWLIDSSKELPQPFNLKELINKGYAIPFDEDAFVPPYQLYGCRVFFDGKTINSEMKLLCKERPILFEREQSYAACFRIVGMQSTGITVSSLRNQYVESLELTSEFYDITNFLLGSLFFITHERYLESEPLDPIWNQFQHAMTHREVIFRTLRQLNKLYQRDIKLNQAEGFILLLSITGMNSCEFEQLGINKEACIEKLLTQLECNKFATFKFLDFRAINGSRKWPFLYALDTAEVLAKDPLIAAFYHHDLLLFSGLINKNLSEAYFHNRFIKSPESEKAQSVMRNLDKVKAYLHKAAALEQPNNLQYAIQVLLQASKYFTYSQFIDACAEIDVLPVFDSKEVDAILARHKFTKGGTLPEVFTKDNTDLKWTMIALILQLEAIMPEKTASHSEAELESLSVTELQEKLQKLWQEGGVLLSLTGKLFLDQILKTIKEISINSAFGLPNTQSLLLNTIGEKIGNLSDFQEYDDFAKVNQIANEISKIAHLFEQILKNPVVSEQEAAFVERFSKIDFSKIDYATLYNFLTLLNDMPQRNYLPLLDTLFSDEAFIGKKEQVEKLFHHLSTLNTNYLPSEYLWAFSRLVMANADEENVDDVVHQILSIYGKDNNDPIVKLIMTDSKLTYKQAALILNFSKNIENNRDKVSQFFSTLVENQHLESFFESLTENKQTKILEIISNGHVLNRKNRLNQGLLNYEELSAFLRELSTEDLDQLGAFYETTPVSAECLLNAFKNPERVKDFQGFLLAFEKAPFGPRDWQQQFATTEVERVVNQAKDLLTDSVYPYHTRKQLMEAFLFVNAIGENLPVYYNKPAKELTNAEIRSFFAALKAKEIPDLTPFQNRLLALGLMREAMYRSTGEFPYSTQMLAVIDSMMHAGDVISSIDTGQGKSQIDTMKAALLWLDSDRVDLTTSSIVDGKRDIANYGSFLKLLNIPYSETPITSTSPTEAFQKNGINFSTFAELSLFFAKAKVRGEVLETPETIISVVLNESDYIVLDNRIIYRFATADSAGVQYGQEWIYYAINEFVTRPEFLNNQNATAADDIADLKAYLRIKARELKKSPKIVDKFSDNQYLSWIESGLMVNYVLEENKHYVIPDEFEKKTIRNTEFRSKVVKVLLRDFKVSPNAKLGGGLEQLLYARLNKERGGNDFVIEPLNKTIISINNKNMIDYYRSHQGYIWGSSATPGSSVEIQEQYRKYGFEFSRVEPHQANKVTVNQPILHPDEAQQFSQLSRLLTVNNPDEKSRPSIVFCKDINTAKRLFEYVTNNNPKHFPLQLYTGLGKEEDFIAKASKPGMITITTSALGRNTDIPYDRMTGLRVWHTFIGSTRDTGQKSGRTGRQGSPGEINYILNTQELNGKSIKQIQETIDKQSALERCVSEELYNILGYFLQQIENIPDEQFIRGKAAFLRESWSQFSAANENQFREDRLNADYNKEAFTQHLVTSFNQMIKASVNSAVPEITPAILKEAIEQIHLATTANYNLYKGEFIVTSKKKVKIRDCVPPVHIAYHLLQLSETEASPESLKDEVKEKLTNLFENLSQDTFMEKNSDYVRYLCSKPNTKTVIVEAHKEFIAEFLRNHSQKLNFFQRWRGFEGKLNKAAQNQNYLLLFHTFASIPNHPIIEIQGMRQAVNTLLDEYLENSWFINRERKKWVALLKQQINKAENFDKIIECLSKAQIETAKQDIETNKHRFKRLHHSGHSRYQSTLSDALSLASSLSGKTNVNDLGISISQLKTDSRVSDPNNFKVLSKIVKGVKDIKLRDNSQKNSMIGRNSFFKPPGAQNHKEKLEDKKTPPSSSKELK